MPPDGELLLQAVDRNRVHCLMIQLGWIFLVS